MEDFYRTNREIVWVIEIGNAQFLGFSRGTAFSISEKLVMTTARMFKGCSTTASIRGRRLHDTGFSYNLNVVYSEPFWDITLMEIKDGMVSDRAGTLAEEGKIKVDENIYNITNIDSNVGAWQSGHSGYECLDMKSIPNLNKINLTCSSFDNSEKGHSYRMLGNIYNNNTCFGSGSGSGSGEKDKLNPYLPIIECCGFAFGGCGGPILNSKGNIIGMIIESAGFRPIAIHVSVLRLFLQNYQRSKGIGQPSEKGSKGIGQSSKKRKGGKKRAGKKSK